MLKCQFAEPVADTLLFLQYHPWYMRLSGSCLRVPKTIPTLTEGDRRRNHWLWQKIIGWKQFCESAYYRAHEAPTLQHRNPSWWQGLFLKLLWSWVMGAHKPRSHRMTPRWDQLPPFPLLGSSHDRGIRCSGGREESSRVARWSSCQPGNTEPAMAQLGIKSFDWWMVVEGRSKYRFLNGEQHDY